MCHLRNCQLCALIKSYRYPSAVASTSQQWLPDSEGPYRVRLLPQKTKPLSLQALLTGELHTTAAMLKYARWMSSEMSHDFQQTGISFRHCTSF